MLVNFIEKFFLRALDHLSMQKIIRHAALNHVCPSCLIIKLLLFFATGAIIVYFVSKNINKIAVKKTLKEY